MEDMDFSKGGDLPEQFSEALDALAEMEQVDVRRGYGIVVSPVVKRHRRMRRRRMAKIAAALFIPMVCAAAVWLYADRGGRQSPVDNSVTLVLADGQEIKVDTLSGKTRLPDQSGATITRLEDAFVYANEQSAAPTEVISVNTVKVPRGNMFEMVLGDGTKVWMNAESNLYFPASFSGSERRVRLEGEAYFAVARDEERPFIVEAGGQMFHVLGTEFNVYAYPGEPAVMATLVSGSISVSKGDRTIILLPGEQSQWDAFAGSFSVKTVDTGVITGWRSGLFVFGDNTLEQVMQKVARWYDLDVVFTDEKLREIEYKGNLERYDDFRTILDIIEKTSPVKFKVKDTRVTVSAI